MWIARFRRYPQMIVNALLMTNRVSLLFCSLLLQYVVTLLTLNLLIYSMFSCDLNVIKLLDEILKQTVTVKTYRHLLAYIMRITFNFILLSN